MQGFPIAHIDVAIARADRQALHMLSNDHTAVTEELHRSLERLHQLRREQGRAASQDPLRHDTREAAAVPAAHPLEISRVAPARNGVPSASPFALVDSVAVGSPATAAGICVRTPSMDSCWRSSLCACSCSKPSVLYIESQQGSLQRHAMQGLLCFYKI